MLCLTMTDSFQELDIIRKMQDGMFRNPILLTQGKTFLFQTWKIVQHCITDSWKFDSLFAEKRIKISRNNRQTNDNKVCLL